MIRRKSLLLPIGCLLLLWLASTSAFRAEGAEPAPAQSQSVQTAVQSPTPRPTPRPLPLPRIITTACIRVSLLSDIAYSFNSDDFRSLSARQDTLNVIVSHGDRLPDESMFDVASAYDAYVPVFVSAGRPLDNISREDLIKVLRGEITDWGGLGAGSGPIRVYLHGGELQKRSFDSFLGTLGLQPDTVRRAGVRSEPSYEQLAEAASGDANALVIGLRNLQTAGLKTIAVDGATVLDTELPKQYPLRVPVFLYQKKEPAAERTFESFLESVRRNNREALGAVWRARQRLRNRLPR